MKPTDRFLIVLVVGVVLLVLAAVFVATQRPGQVGYQSEDTAEGVVFNYLLALQQGDYERAYSYLSPELAAKPESPEAMATDLSWRLTDLERNPRSLSIDGSRAIGDTTVVTVSETHHYRGGLLGGSRYTRAFDVKLHRIADAWKIIHSQEYWYYAWNSVVD